MEKTEKFDRTKEFETEIAPIILELNSRCRKYGIPLFVNCLPYDDEKTTNSRTTVYFGEEGQMRYRNCTAQLGVMAQVAELPFQLQMMLIMLIEKFKRDFKDQLEESIHQVNPGEKTPHARHGEPVSDTSDSMEEQMLNEVLKQLGVSGEPGKEDGKSEDK